MVNAAKSLAQDIQQVGDAKINIVEENDPEAESAINLMSIGKTRAISALAKARAFLSE